jgi:hypothetical protein
VDFLKTKHCALVFILKLNFIEIQHAHRKEQNPPCTGHKYIHKGYIPRYPALRSRNMKPEQQKPLGHLPVTAFPPSSTRKTNYLVSCAVD